MKKINLYVLLTFLVLSGIANAQKINKRGDLNGMKGVKSIDIEFNYDNMSVGKYPRESDYLNDGVAKRNEKKSGSGEEWKMKWVEDRNQDFEPKFEELFNKNLTDGVTAHRENTDAPVTMRISTYFTEPGFNVGVVRKSAYINVRVTFIDKSTGEEFAHLEINKVPGRDAMGYDFDTGYRISEAYAKLGKSLGKYLKDVL